MNKYDVFGIGNALMDIQAFVSDKFLKDLNINKGIMHLIEEDMSRKILEKLSTIKTNSLPGGSCANTLSAMTKLGAKTVFTGIVTDDFYGRLYESKLMQRGVKSLIKKREYGLTGTSIILTTGDAERTMNTHLGVCRDLSKDDVDYSILSSSGIFHTTGYKWDTDTQKEVIEYTMKTAKDAGLKISFDIADPFCVQRNIEDFKRIIKDYIDIVFGNRDEAKILTGKSDPIEAGLEIRKLGAKIVIVKVGKEGSYVFFDDKYEKIDIYTPKKVLDSTGCGDIYAGGFLYGYSKGYDVIKCSKIASYYAAQIISVAGVSLEDLNFSEISDFINNSILK